MKFGRFVRRGFEACWGGTGRGRPTAANTKTTERHQVELAPSFFPDRATRFAFPTSTSADYTTLPVNKKQPLPSIPKFNANNFMG